MSALPRIAGGKPIAQDALRDDINDAKRAITAHKNAVASIERAIKNSRTDAERSKWQEAIGREKAQLKKYEDRLAGLQSGKAQDADSRVEYKGYTLVVGSGLCAIWRNGNRLATVKTLEDAKREVDKLDAMDAQDGPIKESVIKGLEQDLSMAQRQLERAIANRDAESISDYREEIEKIRRTIADWRSKGAQDEKQRDRKWSVTCEISGGGEQTVVVNAPTEQAARAKAENYFKTRVGISAKAQGVMAKDAATFNEAVFKSRKLDVEDAEDREAEMASKHGYNSEQRKKASAELKKAEQALKEYRALRPSAQDASGPIKKGDRVEILPQWRDKGDEKYQWYAVTDDYGGRLQIQPKGTGLTFAPVHTVQTNMVRKL